MNKKMLFAGLNHLINLGVQNIDDKYRITVESLIERRTFAEVEFNYDEMRVIHKWIGSLLEENDKD